MQPQNQERRQSSNLLASRTWSAVATSEALRRRVYLWAIVLGSVILIVTWLMQFRRPNASLYVLFGQPVILLQSLWAAWWLLRGKPLIVAERVVFVVNALAVLGQTLLAMLTDPRQIIGLTSSAYWTLVALSILSFLIFSNRQALIFSASLFALSVALPWGTLMFRGDTLSAYTELARVQVTCGVILALLSGLAWYRESFTMERGHRLSLERLAHTDPLTGLPNRRALYREIEELLDSERQDMGGCFILLDVDHFKRVNDTYGHNVGDEVLIHLAALLRAELREGDMVGRWGGEEFLIILPGLSAELGEHLAERLRLRIEQQAFRGGQGVTASLGVTSCAASDDSKRCIARADRALYAAKTAGRNRVVFMPENEGRGDTQDAVLTKPVL